ncbi:hypothetical protein CEXT_183001, partial [Caerostris extrusa]
KAEPSTDVKYEVMMGTLNESRWLIAHLESLISGFSSLPPLSPGGWKRFSLLSRIKRHILMGPQTNRLRMQMEKAKTASRTNDSSGSQFKMI